MPAYEQETAPLIGTDPASSSGSIDEDARSKSDEKIGYFGRLDMVPSVRDKTAFGLVIAGLGLFVPLTWYMVFSNDLKVSQIGSYVPRAGEKGHSSRRHRKWGGSPTIPRCSHCLSLRYF